MSSGNAHRLTLVRAGPLSSAQAGARWLPGGSLSLSASGALRYLDSTSSFFRTNPTDALQPQADPLTSSPSVSSPSASTLSSGFDYLHFPLDHHLHRQILDLALSRMISYGSFVRASSFREDLSATPLRRTNNYSPFLHLSVLAVGCRYLPSDLQELVCPPGVDVRERGQVFAKAAKAMVEEEAVNPDLALVRGLLVLSSFMVGTGQE